MPSSRQYKSFFQYAFLILLLLAFILFFYFHLYDYLSLNSLKYYKTEAQAWTAAHYSLAVSLYMIIFIILIACAIPCATILTLVGGFLFDIIAILYAEFSITLGGLILYLAVRTTLGSRLAARSTGFIKKIEAGFKQDALIIFVSASYPSCLWVNVAAGILNVPVKHFIPCYLLGILPATIIYVLAGRGLDAILMEDNTPILNILFTPLVLFPLLGLAVLSLFPVIYKWIKKE